MKKFFLLATACLMALASCDDVPAPYEIFNNTENGGNGGNGGGSSIPSVNTRQEPYTVSDAIAAYNAKKSGNFWVKGYMVGTIPTNAESSTMSFAVFGTDNAAPSNLILAATPDETNGNNCMVIQLSAGSDVRTQLNLLDNAGNLGKEVLLYGSLEKYCGTAGLKSVSFCVFGDKEIGNDPSKPAQTTFEHITIAEFLKKADTQTAYELTGVVANIKNTTYGNFDLVEGESSIYIYGLLDKEGKNKQFANMNIAVGDTVTLTGVYKDYNGTAEIADAKYVSHKKGNGTAPNPGTGTGTGTGSNTEVEGDNILTNSGFEDWVDDKTPTNWKSASTASSATLSKVADNPHSGSYAVQANGTTSSNYRLAYKEIKLKAGTYSIVFYARAADENCSVRPGYATFKEDGTLNGSGYKYGDYVNDITSAEWVKVVYTFTLEAEQQICPLVMVSKNPGKSAVIDDFELLTADGGFAE